MSVTEPGKKLRQLLGRKDTVLVVMGAPDAATARMMGKFGCEVAFVGTGITGGRITGLGDTGLLSMTECVSIARYIADVAEFPLILDGDTGHGGPPAVRRLVHECIRAGLAGIRIDDQEIEAKRATQSAGLQIVSREHAIERYKAALAARDELDPSFVIMAQCYARDADNGGMDELLYRLECYEEAGLDWVQFESPHSVDEVRQARAAVKGPFSVMRGKLPRILTLEEHHDLGLTAAWWTFLPNSAMYALTQAFLADLQARGLDAWLDLQQAADRGELLARAPVSA